MTLEDEKRLALLAAILHLGGGAAKSRVLDTLDELNVLHLTDVDRISLTTRREEHWRNDLAYVRQHLVDAGYLSDAYHNHWTITDSGRTYARQLAARVTSSRSTGNFVRLDWAARLVHTALSPALDDAAAENSETVAIEGGIKSVWSTRYERDPTLRGAAIRHHGLQCMGCRFCFGSAYGDLGEGFIEVHHLNPISSTEGPAQVRVETDLVVLCSNCHSMVHRRKGRPLSLADLRAFVSKQAP